jgi:hypothetical protein
MNERIRELAEQATKWAQQAQWSTDPRFGDRPFSDLYNEKFAELIVRECMDNLAWHGHDEAVSQLDWFLHHKIRG